MNAQSNLGSSRLASKLGSTYNVNNPNGANLGRIVSYPGNNVLQILKPNGGSAGTITLTPNGGTRIAEASGKLVAIVTGTGG